MSYVKARRAHSMPSRYVLPSMEMGQYEVLENTKTLSEGKGGQQGNKQGNKPPRTKKTSLPARPRKPKVYSSYNVNPECQVHASKESTPSSSSLRRSVSITRKSSNEPRSSMERSHEQRESIVGRPTSMGMSSARSATMARKPLTASTSSSGAARPSSADKDKDYYFEERYRYTYSSLEPDAQSGRGSNRISLRNMRKPHFDHWTDSMSLLGLSNKMWKETRKRQENFLNINFIGEDSSNRDTYVI